MNCFRCLRDAGVATITPLGGVVLCQECIEVVLKKTVTFKPIYFGRCYRDNFRLCLQDCTHIELGPTVDKDGEPRVESATCKATSTAFDRGLPEGGMTQDLYPVSLQRRTTDEYIAALLLTTRSEDLQSIFDPQSQKETDDVEGPEKENDRGEYREGDE